MIETIKYLIRLNRLRKIRKAEKKREKAEQKAIERSETLYQVCEYHNRLWLLYNGCMVCPMSMFNSPAVDVIATMRVNYVENRDGVRKMSNISM